MRFLVGAACLAVIAYIGYFFWNEYRQQQDAAEHARLKVFVDFQHNCNRLISTHPEYDKAFEDTLSSDESYKRVKQCSEYYETGKLPY